MNPQNTFDPSAADDTTAPVGPQPGQSIEPTSAPGEGITPIAEEPMPSSGVASANPLDPTSVASDPSPLDEPTAIAPQPEAPQPDDLDGVSEPSPSVVDEPEPMNESMAAAPQPEPVAPTPVNVTVEQPASQSSGPQSPPAFMAQPKPAEPSPAAEQPMTPAAPSMPMSDAPGLPPVIVHAGKKSRLWIVVVLIAVLLLAGGGAAAYFLVLKKDKPADNSSTTSQASTQTQKTDDTQKAAETAKPALTAEYSSDLDAVCNGTPIANVAAYSTNKSAVIYTFYNKPNNATTWTSDLVGYGKSYYPNVDDFSKVSVVACLSADESTVGAGLSCDYTDSKNQKVTVSYKSLKYELKFYEAKTAKQIGDSQTIDAPAAECPSFIAYDATTKTAYATPDDTALEAAFDTFVK